MIGLLLDCSTANIHLQNPPPSAFTKPKSKSCHSNVLTISKRAKKGSNYCNFWWFHANLFHDDGTNHNDRDINRVFPSESSIDLLCDRVSLETPHASQNAHCCWYDKSLGKLRSYTEVKECQDTDLCKLWKTETKMLVVLRRSPNRWALQRNFGRRLHGELQGRNQRHLGALDSSHKENTV